MSARGSSEPSNADGAGALNGLRVLEIGEMVSAPYATKLMADLGADVIKVEPTEGDRARTRGPFPPGAEGDPDASGLYLALNTNKRSVVVAPNTDTGNNIGNNTGADTDNLVAELSTEADIIITNFGPDRLRTFGFDADRIRADRPDLVLCSLTPFGLTGPYAGHRAEELTIAHGGGWAYQCPGSSAEADQPPLKVFGHQTDFHAGVAGAMASLAVHDRVRRGGTGDHIDFSAMAHTTGMLEAAVIVASYMNEDPDRLGSRLLNPWGIFTCKPSGEAGRRPEDELIFVVTVEQDQWERLVLLMGEPEWTRMGLFDTVELRLENEDLLAVYLEEWLQEHTVDELWHRGQADRICFAPVLGMADMERQPHLQQRGFFVDVEHPMAGTVTHLGPSFLAHPTMRTTIGPAPLLATTEEAGSVRFGPGRPDSSATTPATTSASAPPSAPASAPGDADRDASRLVGERPLEGLRVLDLSWVWAGPYCGMHLAHLGADVVKIESGQRPGLGRRLPLHPPDVEPTLNTSAYFNQWEQGKLSCTLDLSQPAGVELALKLVANCDVVLENFATGVMDRMGLGYEQLRAANPAIIVASISGYGSSGPLKDYMGYGPTTGPLSGLTSLTGYPGGPPRELGISVGDPAAGITAAFAICAAVIDRRTTGQGCYIDAALWEATASHAVEGWMAHAMGAPQPTRAGNRDPNMAPHGCYRTGSRLTDPDVSDQDSQSDQDSESILDSQSVQDSGPDGPDPGLWVSIACTDDDDWQALARCMDEDHGRQTLADDPRFSSASDRKANEDKLDELIGRWVLGQDRWAVTSRLQQAGVAAFPSLSPQDLLADPHLNARGFLERLDHPEVGRRTHTGVPWLMAESPNGVTRPAPLLGEHTADILREFLGLTPSEIVDLEAKAVIT